MESQNKKTKFVPTIFKTFNNSNEFLNAMGVSNESMISDDVVLYRQKLITGEVIEVKFKLY